MLPSLLRKAIGDAGFDLLLGSDAEWERIGVSGVPGTVWVLPIHKGALLAVADVAIAKEFQTTSWTEVPLPAGAASAIRCQSAAELFDVLRRVRVLIAQLPPVPAQRFAARLAAIGATEADALVRQRVGQTLFREMLMEYWEGKCAVTGLGVPELLRASHCKPWSVSNDHERLDVYNGLLLAVHLDALFDQGLIAFTADGSGVISDALNPAARQLLLPDGQSLRLARVTASHQAYLNHHRYNVYRS